MNRRNRITLILTLIVLTNLFVINFIQSRNYIEEVELSKFVPFSEKNVLTKAYAEFKVTGDLPKIEGASAFYPFTASLVQTIYNKADFKEELCTLVSTGKAYEDILNGKADIVIVSEPSTEQKEMIKSSNVELEFVPIFTENLAIITNVKNHIENLRVEQIKAMYEGGIDAWDIVGGRKEAICTYKLEKNNGSQTCFENVTTKFKIDNCHFETKTMQDIITSVGKDKNGLCYAFCSYYNGMYKDKRTKIIDVNGKSIYDEDYPLQYDIYLIYDKNNPNENVKKIVDFLESRDGKVLIREIRGV